MIAQSTQTTVKDDCKWHEGFLKILPAIEQQARFAFRGLDEEAREEAVAEVTASTMCAYRRLFNRGELDRAFPHALARYAIRQYCAGRRMGANLNVRDAMSPYCQKRKGVVVKALHRKDKQTNEWREIVVEDRRATPADVAATRIDFEMWLESLSKRDRKMAETLAQGESTSQVAKKFRVSWARVSQIRKELYNAWREFQGELAPAAS